MHIIKRNVPFINSLNSCHAMLVITPVKYRVNVERSESLWTDTVHSYVPLSDVSLQEYLQYAHHLPKRWSLPGLCVPALQHTLVDSVRTVLQWATLRWLDLYWAGRYNSTPSNTPWVCMRKGCVHIPLPKISVSTRPSDTVCRFTLSSDLSLPSPQEHEGCLCNTA